MARVVLAEDWSVDGGAVLYVDYWGVGCAVAFEEGGYC